MEHEPSFNESVAILNSSIQSFGISIGDAVRVFLQLRALYDFPSNIVTAPDGIPISDTEYADVYLGDWYQGG